MILKAIPENKVKIACNYLETRWKTTFLNSMILQRFMILFMCFIDLEIAYNKKIILIDPMRILIAFTRCRSRWFVTSHYSMYLIGAASWSKYRSLFTCHDYSSFVDRKWVKTFWILKLRRCSFWSWQRTKILKLHGSHGIITKVI